MSNFFDDLEAQLDAAAHGRGTSGLRRMRSGVPILAAVAVALAVAVVALTSVGHSAAPGGSAGPSHGDHSSPLHYVLAARRSAMGTAPCRARGLATPPAEAGSPSAALLASLAVLRRPATAADRLPRSVQGPVRGVYTRYIRLARVKDGVSYYVVPVANALPFAVAVALPARCLTAMHLALRARLSRIPPSLRVPTLRLMSLVIARQRAAAKLHSEPGICLLVESAGGSGGTCAATPTELAQHGLVSVLGPAIGVVPDGVASVTVSDPAGQGLPARSATSDVVGNVFVTSLPLPRAPKAWPAMTWRSAQGKVIKRIPATRHVRGPSFGFCSGRGGGPVPASKPC